MLALYKMCSCTPRLARGKATCFLLPRFCLFPRCNVEVIIGVAAYARWEKVGPTAPSGKHSLLELQLSLMLQSLRCFRIVQHMSSDIRRTSDFMQLPAQRSNKSYSNLNQCDACVPPPRHPEI
jgi:hypothetical protein